VRPGRPQRRDSRAATFFLLLGCFTVLGVTFTAGVVAGRHWPSLLPSIGWPRDAGPRAAARAPAARPGLGGPATGTARPAEAPPVLTFYQELTAPLTAPPPPAKPRAVERAPRPESVRGDGAGAADARPARPDRAAGERRFTVQAGAFKTREQAEALRTKLFTAGHDAHVVEVDGAARYRVRVGSFTSREEASRAARAVTATAGLPTYVTLR